ncbi:MAG: DUF973 family protein [Zestosphaera sp.]
MADALTRMRDGLLLIFIAWILLGAGIMSIFMGMFATLALEGLIIGGVLSLTGAVLALVGFYSKFVPGAGDLARANPEFATSSTLIKVGYIWGLILIMVGVVLTIILVGVLLILAGVVLMVLGYVGVIIMCFKLNDAYSNTLYIVAGILFIIAIFMPVLGAISWILLYAAMGDTINKVRTSLPQQQPPL